MDDLYDVFSQESYDTGAFDLPLGATVSMVMASWTGQSGYPVITVMRDYEANKITVSQVRVLTPRLIQSVRLQTAQPSALCWGYLGEGFERTSLSK